MSFTSGPLAALRARAAHGPDADDAGFTIIEVMVALAIFALVATGAIAGAIAGTTAASTSSARVAGTNVAQNDLEQARVNPTPAATSYTIAPNGGGRTYSVTRSVTTIAPASASPGTCPAGGERHVSVVVTWPGKNGIARLDTVVAC